MSRFGSLFGIKLWDKAGTDEYLQVSQAFNDSGFTRPETRSKLRGRSIFEVFAVPSPRANTPLPPSDGKPSATVKATRRVKQSLLDAIKAIDHAKTPYHEPSRLRRLARAIARFERLHGRALAEARYEDIPSRVRNTAAVALLAHADIRVARGNKHNYLGRQIHQGLALLRHADAPFSEQAWPMSLLIEWHLIRKENAEALRVGTQVATEWARARYPIESRIGVALNGYADALAAHNLLDDVWVYRDAALDVFRARHSIEKKRHSAGLLAEALELATVERIHDSTQSLTEHLNVMKEAFALRKFAHGSRSLHTLRTQALYASAQLLKGDLQGARVSAEQIFSAIRRLFLVERDPPQPTSQADNLAQEEEFRELTLLQGKALLIGAAACALNAQSTLLPAYVSRFNATLPPVNLASRMLAIFMLMEFAQILEEHKQTTAARKLSLLSDCIKEGLLD